MACSASSFGSARSSSSSAASCGGVLVARPRAGDRPGDDLVVADADEQLGRGADQRRPGDDAAEVEVEQVRRWVDAAQGPIDLERAARRRHAEAAGEDASAASRRRGSPRPAARRRPRTARGPLRVRLRTARRSAATGAGRSVPAGVGQRRRRRRRGVSLRRRIAQRRNTRDLREVVEDDHRRRQVEDRLRQAERIGFRHRHALPAGDRLVGEVADARARREGRIADRRRPMREDAAQRFERIGGRRARRPIAPSIRIARSPRTASVRPCTPTIE